MANTTIAKPQSGWSSFFSSVGSGLSEGLHTIGSEILPVWTANQLHLQSKDQLRDSTVNRSLLPLSWTNQWESIQHTMGAADDYATLKKPLFTAGGIKINALVIVGGVMVILMAYLFTRK